MSLRRDRGEAPAASGSASSGRPAGRRTRPAARLSSAASGAGSASSGRFRRSPAPPRSGLGFFRLFPPRLGTWRRAEPALSSAPTAPPCPRPPVAPHEGTGRRRLSVYCPQQAAGWAGLVRPGEQGLSVGAPGGAGNVKVGSWASRSHVQGRGWGQGGRPRRCGGPSAQHAPLEDAGVLPSQRDEVRVVVSEADACHMAAVAREHAARRLRQRKSLRPRNRLGRGACPVLPSPVCS